MDQGRWGAREREGAVCPVTREAAAGHFDRAATRDGPLRALSGVLFRLVGCVWAGRTVEAQLNLTIGLTVRGLILNGVEGGASVSSFVNVLHLTLLIYPAARRQHGLRTHRVHPAPQWRCAPALPPVHRPNTPFQMKYSIATQHPFRYLGFG